MLRLAAAALLALGAAAATALAAGTVSAVNPKALPLGDGHVGGAPKVGYVYSCRTTFGGIGGAQAIGAWIDETGKTWDRTKKPTVQGAVSWPQARYVTRVAGSKRTFSFNDLPIGHATGTFPIASGDPASAYDPNPNSVAAQGVSWSVPLDPRAAAKPSCTPMGPIGVLADGAFLYNALDGEGRDAAAHEILDVCGGHPDPSSSYHHHDVPSCLIARAPKGAATLVGYALDGFGVYVVKDAAGNLPADAALDACHGTTSTVRWNGKQARVYHYVATLEYPYSVGCFHGTPIATGRGGPP
jgi:YHYH protein